MWHFLITFELEKVYAESHQINILLYLHRRSLLCFMFISDTNIALRFATGGRQDSARLTPIHTVANATFTRIRCWSTFSRLIKC